MDNTMRVVVLILIILFGIYLLLFGDLYLKTHKNKELIRFTEQDILIKIDSLQNKVNSLDSVIRFKIIKVIEENKNLTTTSYNSLPDQCWGNPYETASQTHVSFKTLALSQDMITFYVKHRPKGKFCYGDTVWLLFLKPFIVEDTMHKRYTRRVDIWNDDYRESVLFGKQKVFLVGKNYGN